MVKKLNKTFQMRVNDVNLLFDELLKYNIAPEKSDGGFTFEIQSSNTCYTIKVNVIENFSQEEQLFMLNEYPQIKTFADIQMRIFDEVIWNRR